MAEGTGGDSLQVWLTGVHSAGMIQRDSRHSLGGHRSGTRAESLRAFAPFPLPNLRVVHTGGQTPRGSGEIELLDADGECRFREPGATAFGAVVTVPLGARRVLPGSVHSAWVVVERTAEIWAAATMIVQVVEMWNAALGFHWGPGETEARERRYRCFRLVNASGSVLPAAKLWVGPQRPYARIALDAIDGEGRSRRSGNERFAPPGLEWNASTTKEAGIQLGDLDPGEEVALWVEVRPPEDAAATTQFRAVIRTEFVDDGLKQMAIQGLSTLARADAAGYAVWIDPAGRIGLETPPDEFLPALPGQLEAVLGEGTHQIFVARVDHFGLSGSPIGRTVVVDGDGDGSPLGPAAPVDGLVQLASNGRVQVSASWHEGLNEDGAAEAVEWLVFVGLGEDPDPAGEPAVRMPFGLLAGFTGEPQSQGANLTGVPVLMWLSDSYAEGTPLRVAVAVAAEGDVRSPAVQLDEVEAVWVVDGPVDGEAFLGQTRGLGERLPAFGAVDWLGGGSGAAGEALEACAAVRRRGRTELWFGGALVFSADAAGNVVTEWTFVSDDTPPAWFGEPGTASEAWDPIEIMDQDTAFVLVDGLRVARIDAAAKTITAVDWEYDEGAIEPASRGPRGMWSRFGESRVQVWSAEEPGHKSVLAIDGDGHGSIEGWLHEEPVMRVAYIDIERDVRWQQILGDTSLWVGGVCVFRLLFDSDGESKIQTNFGWIPEVVGDAEGEADGIHVDESGKRVQFVLAETCWLEVDVERRTIQAAALVFGDFGATAAPDEVPYREAGGSAFFQVFDADDQSVQVVGEFDSVSETLSFAMGVESRGEPVEGW